MEIKVGIQNVGREIVLETKESAEDVAKNVAEAISAGSVLTLTDEKNRKVYVPGAAIGYVEIGTEEVRRVGFGTV